MTDADPLGLCRRWLAEAEKTEPINPNAAALATVRRDGGPAVRMVLIKDLGPSGPVFYTNLDSRKGDELRHDQRAALCLYWKSLGRQVRLEGSVTPVADVEADAYFASRPRESQIGAWASHQSQPITDRRELEAAVAAISEHHAGRAVPRPPHWSGFRLTADLIEFWTERPSRLHDRIEYRRRDGAWIARILSP